MTSTSAASQIPTEVCTATLALVPPRVDRLRLGRDLAAPMLGGRRHDATLARRGIHPDVIELLPPEKKEKIGIAQVRELIRVAQFTPVQADRKLCLIPRAETLTPEAANALLKILEEPPRGMVFVLLAEQSGDLLPTIASRSRIVRLAPEPDADRIAPLTEAGYTASEAAWLSAICTRDGELDPFMTDRIDLVSLHRSTASELSQSDAPSLIQESLGPDPVRRAVGFRALLRRLESRDPEMLTQGIRFLSTQPRESLFLFLQELQSAAFGTLRKAIESDKSDAEQSAMSELCQAIDRANEALTVYSPVEGLLLTLFLIPGGGTHAE